MSFLILSILSSTIIYTIFKLFKRFDVDNFQAIVFNYYAAAGVGFLLVPSTHIHKLSVDIPWLPFAGIVGVLFISLFYLMALTGQKSGVTVTSIASKMSMVIPAAFFILFDPEEGLTPYKVIGISLGVIAVVLSSLKGKKNPLEKNSFILPLILFVGSGILDLILAYVEKYHLDSPGDHSLFVPVPFALAGFLGTLVLVGLILKGKQRLKGKNLVAGILLGLVNYGSIYFLLRFLGEGFFDHSSVIPLNNMGVVALSALVGFFAFRERLTRLNILGILLSFVAMALLTQFSF